MLEHMPQEQQPLLINGQAIKTDNSDKIERTKENGRERKKNRNYWREGGKEEL
jgi:hypothetical protein